MVGLIIHLYYRLYIFSAYLSKTRPSMISSKHCLKLTDVLVTNGVKKMKIATIILISCVIILVVAGLA